MVKEGQKGDSTYRANERPFPLIKKEFKKLIFHSLAYKIATFECLNKVNSRRNMFFRKIDKIAL